MDIHTALNRAAGKSMHLGVRQKCLLVATAVLLLLELIYAPTARCSYQGCQPTGYYDFIWNRGQNQQIHTSGLVLLWVCTLLVSGVLFFLLQEPKGPSTETGNDRELPREGGPNGSVAATNENPLPKNQKLVKVPQPVDQLSSAESTKDATGSANDAKEPKETSIWGIVITIGIASALGGLLARALFSGLPQ